MTWSAWLHLFFPQPVPVQLAEAQAEVRRLQVDVEVLELRCDELALLNEQLRQHLLANVAVAKACANLCGVQETHAK